MPRRFIFSTNEINNLLAIPEDQDNLIRHYTFGKKDLPIIRQRRGDSNRLGFAIQLCYMRYPGIFLGMEESPPAHLVDFVANQLKIRPESWNEYGKRGQTRREHLTELQSVFGYKAFTVQHHQLTLASINEAAKQTDKGIEVAIALIQSLRNRLILLPKINVIRNICAEAMTQVSRNIYHELTEPLSEEHFKRLDALLKLRPTNKLTTMAWLRQSPIAPNAKHMLEHIERLKVLQALQLPEGIEKLVHYKRLVKMAREGSKMTPKDLGKFEIMRRYATLIAIALETEGTVTDEIIELNDRIIGAMYNRAKRNHEEQFKELNTNKNSMLRLFCQVVHALSEAKRAKCNPYAAIEQRVIPWDQLILKINEVERLILPEYHDFLYRVVDSYPQIRRYSPAFLEVLQFKAVPAAREILDGVDILKAINAGKINKIPSNAPTKFIRNDWKPLVMGKTGFDRRYYELCVLVELKNSLRSGDVWVQSSRQFKNFNEYLLPAEKFTTLKEDNELPLAVAINCNEYLDVKLSMLHKELDAVERLAKKDALPDATITDSRLKITPLDNAVPDEVEAFARQVTGLLPHVKVTDVLLEVDAWTNFSEKFVHIKSNETAKNKTQLLTSILADGINLGLSKMSESCPGASYAQLSWLQAWYVRDETYSAALAKLVNAQYRQPMAAYWGEGTTSSSDGQRFRVGSHAKAIGHVNPKYGSEPGLLFYTHISDQYAPFHTKVINVGVRDATYVLDGLLAHGSDLRIEEHYTDTAGFTDQVFALMSLLGFYFAPRIRNLNDIRLYTPDSRNTYPAINALIGDAINKPLIVRYWDEILRLATSIQQGTVTTSLMLKKLGSYPRQSGLAMALREIGRIERTLFILKWLQKFELRRRIHIGLNKGEARNALARAVFFNRMGEVRDRSFENQRYRASGLNLVTAAIILWNTVYLERAINALKANGTAVDNRLIENLSPLSWDHINLTGDYIWQNKQYFKDKFRRLRPFQRA